MQQGQSALLAGQASFQSQIFRRLTVKSAVIEAWQALRLTGKDDSNPFTTLFGALLTFTTRMGDSGIREPATKLPIDTFINAGTKIGTKTRA